MGAPTFTPAHTLCPPRPHSVFWFTGVSEYLEDLLARIDAPRLNSLEIFIFHQLIFNMPQLIQFIRRAPFLYFLSHLRLSSSSYHMLSFSALIFRCPKISFNIVIIGYRCRVN
jgi:hypothetical protein